MVVSAFYSYLNICRASEVNIESMTFFFLKIQNVQVEMNRKSVVFNRPQYPNLLITNLPKLYQFVYKRKDIW